MQTNISNSRSRLISRTETTTFLHPWLMLISRSILFIIFQVLIALILMVMGTSSAWDASARWWTFVAILANIVSIYLLVRIFKVEGKRYFEVISFSRPTLKTDLLWFFVASPIGLPIAAIPTNILGAALFSNAMVPINMMFRPLPIWAFLLSFLFPLTIAFAELPT
jgi:hypothetical protein